MKQIDRTGMRARMGALALAALAALAFPARAQEKPGDSVNPAEEKKLTFKFKDASVDGVLQYVSSVTGWIFVQEKKISGTIDAVSDTDVPVSKCIDFLNSALRRYEATILNPYSPALPKVGQVLKVQDKNVANQRNIEIYMGADPDQIPITDQVRTQIIPLKAVNVVDVNKELGEVLRKAVDDVSVSTYSNSMVLTGRSEGINRAARILRVIDVSASAELKIRVFPLKFADAAEVAKTLNEVFKKETTASGAGGGGRDNPMGNIFRMFGGGGGGGGGGAEGGGRGGRGGDGPSPRALAYEVVRITAEPRTNSVIVSATEDNINLIKELLDRLDDKTAGAAKLKLYALKYADATSVAKLVNDLFSQTPTNASTQQNRGRGGGVPPWMAAAGGQGAASESPGATHEVRAVADIRTNSVMVGASDQTLLLIDKVMLDVDRPVNDMLIVKVYELKNADPVQMTTILTALFRPQINATQNAGHAAGAQQGAAGGFGQPQVASFGGGGRGGAGGGQPGAAPTAGSGLLPSQEVEVTNDPRTRSVIVKASREYIAIIDDVVKQLDNNPTDTATTYVFPLRNGDAQTLATLLQNLLRSTQPAGVATSTTTQNNRPTAGTGPFSGMQQQTSGGTSSGFGGGSSGLGGGLGGGRGLSGP